MNVNNVGGNGRGQIYRKQLSASTQVRSSMGSPRQFSFKCVNRDIAPVKLGMKGGARVRGKRGNGKPAREIRVHIIHGLSCAE